MTIPQSWKVGNLPYDYSAPVDAIAYHENAIDDAAVADPALYAARALRDLAHLRRHHGRRRRPPRHSTQRERIAIVESPPLSQLLTTMLKNSQNLYAEMLFKNAGGGTYDAAIETERRFVNELGIDPHDIRFVDGSGLSPDDLVAPAAIVNCCAG